MNDPLNNASSFSLVVVDDEPAIRMATTRLFRKEGYFVADAASGAEGKSLILKTVPDLVLMDVNLGDADGRDLCKALKKAPSLKNTFFVLLSASEVTTDDQVRGLNDGADGYIVRPIENRELIARIQAFLRIAATERELERFNKMAIDRELRMIELKQEINALCKELGREEKYSIHS